MKDSELTARINLWAKEIFNPNCPIHNFQEGHNHQNIKICQDCADRLEWSFDPEIELISQYSKN